MIFHVIPNLTEAVDPVARGRRLKGVYKAMDRLYRTRKLPQANDKFVHAALMLARRGHTSVRGVMGNETPLRGSAARSLDRAGKERRVSAGIRKVRFGGANILGAKDMEADARSKSRAAVSAAKKLRKAYPSRFKLP